MASVIGTNSTLHTKVHLLPGMRVPVLHRSQDQIGRCRVFTAPPCGRNREYTARLAGSMRTPT